MSSTTVKSSAAGATNGPVLNKRLKKKSLILDDGNVYKIQKVRQRRILSCIPCHQRKIKCSRGTVCEHCRKNNLSCQYFINDKLSNLKKSEDAPVLKTIVKETKRHGTRSRSELGVEGKVSDNGVAKRTAAAVGDPENDQKDVEQKEVEEVIAQDQVPTLNQVVDQEREQDDLYDEENSSSDTDSSHENYSPLKTEEPVVPMEQEIPGFGSPLALEMLLPCDDDDERGYEISSSSLSNDDSHSPASSQTPLTAISPITPTTTSKTYPHKMFKTISLLESVVVGLPSRQRSDELLDIYTRSVVPLLPLIDIVSFRRTYLQFWSSGLHLLSNIKCLYLKTQDFGGFENIESLFQFLLLFLLMLTCALASNFQSAPCPTDEDLLLEYKRYYEHFKVLNVIAMKNAKKLDTLNFQVNLLVLSFNDLSKTDTFLEVSQLIKIAQYYKLDHDPVIHGNLNNEPLVQLKRLLWWQIFKLDDLVSSYQRLSSTIKLNEFDTSLPAENCDQLLPMLDDQDSTSCCNFSNYTIGFVNSKFRFYLLQNELNALSNGLNASLNDTDINNLKFKINDLYIFCYSSIISLQNSEKLINYKISGLVSCDGHTMALTQDHFLQQLKFISYAKSFLNVLADKILIKLQLRILLTPNSVMSQLKQQNDKFYSDNVLDTGSNERMYFTHDSTELKFRFMLLNLNLVMNKNMSYNYNYNDLSTNLLPSLLHSLSVFIDFCEFQDPRTGEDLSCFNWELRNYLPIEELVLLTTILVVNLKGKSTELEDLEMKTYVIDTAVNYLACRWGDKSSGMRKTTEILSLIWSMVKVKYNLVARKKYYRVPEPSLSPTAHSTPPTQQRTTISCAEIAPRTMRAQISHSGPYPMVDDALDMNFGGSGESYDSKRGYLGAEVLEGDGEADSQELKVLESKIQAELSCDGDMEEEEQEEYFKYLKQELNDLFTLTYI